MPRLEKQEYGQARRLWEAVFEEDTKAFLDYYEACVTDHNQIFAEKRDGKVISMLHLNPYRMRMGQAEFDSRYIVAVATDRQYRHQGYMRSLLKEAMQSMYQEMVPFAFLMPASEEIYRPFDFVTVYQQSMISIGAPLEKEEPSDWTCRPCRKEQLRELAEWSEHFLRESCEISTVRSTEYYERIWKEQEAMNGGILLFYEQEQLKGYCFSGCEGSTECWEIAVKDETAGAANRKAAETLTEYLSERGQLPVRIEGFLPESDIEGMPFQELAFRPMTMIRLIHLKEFVKHLRAKETVCFELQIEDPMLAENNGCFRFILGSDEGILERICPNHDSPPSERKKLTIRELTACFFGKKEMEGIPFEKIRLPKKIYLNEIV